MILESLNISEAKNIIKTDLSTVYTSNEIQQLTYIIFEHILGFSKLDVNTKFRFQLTKSQLNQVKYILLLLKQHMPIEYITGNTLFYDLKFNVTKDVLIPRPETEELVDWIIKSNTIKAPKIIDIGTGSGCIGITLARNILNANVDCLDNSKNAIDVARINAKKNLAKVNFIERDILCTLHCPKYAKYDIIVSNPPYVMLKEKEQMKANVLNYEPHDALFVPDNNPLMFYKAIIDFATEHLKPNGVIYFEINEALSSKVTCLLNTNGFLNVIVRKDINEKFRFVKATRK